MTPPDDARVLGAVLARIARRLWLRRAVRWLLRGTAGIATALTVLELLHVLAVVPDPRRASLIGAITVVLALAVAPGFRPLRRPEAATVADTIYGLDERLVTAMEPPATSSAIHQLVVRDAARAASRLDLGRIRPAIGRDAWLALATVASAGALWYGLAPSGVGVRPPPEAHALRPAPVARAGGAGRSPRAHDQAAGRELRQALGLDEGSAASPARPGVRLAEESVPRAAAGSAGADRQEAIPDSPGATPPDAGAGSSPHSASAASRPARTARGESSGVDGPGGQGAARATAAGPASRITDRPGGAGQPPAEQPRPSESRAARVRASDGVAARLPLAPALRQYVLRYFDELGR